MIDPVSPIATLKESVEKQLTSARLQELTRLVIEAHRGGDVALLRAYAERAGLGPEVVSAPARTLFIGLWLWCILTSSLIYVEIFDLP